MQILEIQLNSHSFFPRQSGPICGADGGPRERPDDPGDILRAVLRHLWAVEGRLRVHQDAGVADLPGRVDRGGHLDEVN